MQFVFRPPCASVTPADVSAVNCAAPAAHIVRPKLVPDEEGIGDAVEAPPPAILLMTLQRSPHSAVADDTSSGAWPSTFMFV